jgi:mitochondrial distribution and morphology protein 31
MQGMFTIRGGDISESYTEFIARKISDYLTRETGWTVVFESAIVPKWKDGKISFKRTYISRHPDLSPPSVKREDNVLTHPAHTAATRSDVHYPAFHYPSDEDVEIYTPAPPIQYEKIEDLSPEQRITTFDLEVDSVDVQLSFQRWFDGKGLVENAVIKGVRGVIGKFLLNSLDSRILIDLITQTGAWCPRPPTKG